MSRVEGSIWRCTVRVFDELTLSRHECDDMMEQAGLEQHLRSIHKMKVSKPDDVMPHFVLVRAALMRGPARRGILKDQSDWLEMFTHGRDFT